MVDVTIPQIGESITSVFIARWIKQPGEAVNAGDPIVELDSDKASMEVPSPTSGVLVEVMAAEGDEIDIGAIFARIDETQTAPTPAPAKAAGPSSKESDEASAPVKAGPAARQAATEKGVDLTQITGTGPKGRVLSSDVKTPTTVKAVPEKAAGQISRPVEQPREVRVQRVPMTSLRRTIARRLVQSQQTAAMLTTFNEVDMSPIMEIRSQYKQKFIDRHGIKLGFMSFFMKATIEALKEFPAVNSEIDGNDILYKNYYNIGVAVSGKKGLVVPVVKNADQLSFAQTELAIGDLAKKARDNKLRLDDFKDGTFTISNGGIFGSMMSTPILNPPQVGILGMHNIIKRPVGVNGEIVLRPMMYLALSYDHRIIDGREAVSFLVRIKECLEDPRRMLLEV